MKNLVLKDGSVVEFIDTSTLSSLVTVVNNFTDVENLRFQLSQENLSECEFDGIAYTDVTLKTVIASADAYGSVQVAFYMATTETAEIEALKQQLSVLQTENATLIDENQALIDENETLTDKADAADILLGNVEV